VSGNFKTFDKSLIKSFATHFFFVKETGCAQRKPETACVRARRFSWAHTSCMRFRP